ncbi:hypothetical protein [Streptomyces rimosus]|uniref:hypothetical protein n=1 Tax=Streptomyces rimosus TaxID=1927 RepID=UPI0004C219B9|nr:hypothetical protein [Streptomyces rimosus]
MHYTDDPLMDEVRREHRLLLEPVGTHRTLFGGDTKLYAAACSAGDWMDPRRYDHQAHQEGFDQHMAEVQQRVHAETEADASGDDGHPDQEA